MLTGYVKITREYVGNTKFDFWKNLKVGDYLEVKTIKTYETTHAPKYKFTNLRTNETFEGIDRQIWKCRYEEVVPHEFADKLRESFKK